MPQKRKHPPNGEKNDEAEDFGPYADEKSDDQLNVDKVDFSRLNVGTSENDIKEKFEKGANEKKGWDSNLAVDFCESVDPDKSFEPRWYTRLIEAVASINR